MLYRTLLTACVGLAAIAPGTAFAQDAESYPDEQIRLVIPYSPGGATDVIFRLAAEQLEQDLGETVVVVNMPGASATRGSREVKNAEPDGYTILGSHDTIATSSITGVVDYSFEAFEPISLLTQTPNMAAVNSDTDFETIEQFASYVKENPGELAWGITPGSTSHFFALMMLDSFGAEPDALNLITYEGTGEEMAGVQRGEIVGAMMNYTSGKGRIDDGTFTPLAVAHDERLPQMPGTPTFREAGYDMVHSTSRGLFAPKGTPEPIIQRLAEAAKATTQSEEFRQRIEGDLGSVVRYMPPEEYAEFLSNIQEQLRTIADQAGM